MYVRYLARGVHKQLLRDTVGPVVGRRDLARQREVVQSHRAQHIIRATVLEQKG